MRRFLVLVFLAVAVPLKGQTYVSRDFDFANYLIDNSLKGDALTLLFEGDYNPSDTLDYLRGWAAYSSGKLDTARTELSKIGSGSVYYDKALFYNVICNAHLGDCSSAEALLESYKGPHTELLGMEWAGICLLEGDMEGFESRSKDFSYSPYQLTEAEKRLVEIYDTRMSHRPKLALKYKRKTVLDFLAVASCAAMTAESWSKKGPDNWETIFLGAAAIGFSIKTVCDIRFGLKISEQQFNDGEKTAVLYSIHIPLRSYFK